MNDHRRFFWIIEKETVTYCLAPPFPYVYLMHNSEVVGVLAFNGQSSWVIIQISLPVVKLPRA